MPRRRDARTTRGRMVSDCNLPPCALHASWRASAGTGSARASRPGPTTSSRTSTTKIRTTSRTGSMSWTTVSPMLRNDYAMKWNERHVVNFVAQGSVTIVVTTCHIHDFDRAEHNVSALWIGVFERISFYKNHFDLHWFPEQMFFRKKKTKQKTVSIEIPTKWDFLN